MAAQPEREIARSARDAARPGQDMRDIARPERDAAPPTRRACEQCLRRSRLLGLLSARIEHAARDIETLHDLLALDDSVLIEAIGGRRKEELRSLHAAPLPAFESAVASLCVHSATALAPTLHAVANGVSGSADRPAAAPAPVPRMLGGGVSGRPAAVSFAGQLESLDHLAAEPIVSIVGTTKPSPYGAELASMLARKLSLCGVTVAAAFDEGIAAAAHRGALASERPTLAVLAGGIDVCKPAWLGPLWRRLHAWSCLLTQMPQGLRARRWGVRLREATLLGISDLVILVEAQDGAALEAAKSGLSQGKLIAAAPGRLTSPLSSGPHQLISRGARLLTGAEQVLDLLHLSDRHTLGESQASGRSPRLAPSLQGVLDRIEAGEDGLAALASGPHGARALLALGELEARGLIGRTDGGRYVPRLG